MKGLIDDNFYPSRYVLAGIKLERHLEADSVTAISFPNTKDHGYLAYSLGRRYTKNFYVLSTLEHNWAFVRTGSETAFGTVPATACETAHASTD